MFAIKEKKNRFVNFLVYLLLLILWLFSLRKTDSYYSIYVLFALFGAFAGYKNYFEIAHSLNRQFAKGGIYEGKHFYNFLDNHDVNRIASLLKDKRDLANAYTLMFLMPGIPSIYYGSEWGIDGVKTSGREADRPIRPSMEEIQGRTRNYNLAAYISQLSKLRKSSKVLAYGGFENVIIRNQQYVFARFLDDEWILAAFNISEQEEHFSFNYRGKDYSFKLEPHANIIM